MTASKNTAVLHVAHILNVCVGLMFSVTSPFTPWELTTWEATWSTYQWVTQLAGWPEKLHVAALCNQWQPGEAFGTAWDSWSGTRQRVTELRSQAPQESKRLAREKHTHTVLTATEAEMQLSALAHCLNFLDYLWEEKENTSEREYMDLSFMSCMKAWLFGNAGVSHCTLPGLCPNIG